MTREESLEIIRRASGGNTPAASEPSQTVQDNTQQQSYGARSREESLRIIQSAMGGGSTAGAGPQSATPQSAAPTAPLTQGSLAGGAEQVTQASTAAKPQMTQSEAQAELDRLKPVLEQAKQYENEMGRYVSGAGQDPALYHSALTRRDSMLKKYGYSSVDELNKAVMDYTLAAGNELSLMQKLDRAGSAMEEGLKKTVLSGDWWKNVVLGGAEQWSGSQLNAAGTTAGNIESIGKEGAGMVYENELRARNDWATTLEEAKTGVIQMDADGIKEIENIIAYYDNILLPSLRSGVQAYETLAEDSAAAADEITAKGQQNTEKAKEGLGWGGKMAVDLLTQGTMMALDKATGAPNISMFTRGLGSGAQEARQAGSTAQEQIGYGAAVGTVEVLTNKLFDGLAGIYGKGAADDLVEATIAKLAKSRDGQAALRLLASGFNEGIEETLSDAVNPLLRTIYSDKSIKEEYSEEQLSQWLYDGLVGGIMGTGMTAINPNTYVLNTGDTQTSADQKKFGLQPQADGQAEEQTAGMAETPTAQTQEKSYPTVEELIQPIRPAGNADAGPVAPAAAGGNAPVNAGVQATAQGQTAGQQVMTREEQAQKEAEWWANREKEAEKAYEDAKKRYEETLNGGTADETDFLSSPEMRKVLMDMAKKDLEDVRNRKIPSPFSDAEAQAAGTTVAEEIPQPATPTAPLAEEPLRAATQGRPYSQPGQGAELNARQEAQTQAEGAAQEAQRATPQAETPPTTQNAAQTASGELNLRDEGNVSSSDYDTQRQESLMFSEAPQEAVHNTDSFDAVTATDDFQNRDFNDVGNRKIKAYMYENPEVKPFFQFEAEAMLNDLKNSVKGERFYNSQLAYDSGYEYGWTGNKRLVSDDIAVLLDYGYSYEEIEKGLKAIIEDDGRENNACSKRIEFLLNDRLMDGYTDWQSNEFVPPNQEYRNMILEKQINAYSKEAFEEYLKNAERYAPKDAKINSNGQSNPQGADTVQGQETTEEQNTAPAAYNQTTGQREQPDGADTVRGFSKNVATDSAMEMALREDIAANPDLYKRLSNKETLQKALDIFAQGLDTARTELERAIGAAQSGQKFPIEMVPLSRMVVNELTRRGDLPAARKITSDVAAELTGAGELGQAGAILRNADPITVLNTLQKTLDSINKEVSGKQGTSRNRKAADSTGAELENAVKDAAGKLAENEEIRNAVKREIDRSRSGKGKGGEKQEASVAEILRDALKRDAFSRIKPKTTDPQKELVKSLKRFAMEKLPPKQGTRQKTATDVLSDYVKNQEMFTEAWEDAQQMLREDEQVKWNPVIKEILGGFLNTNYPENIRGKIMTKALAEEAMNTGETKETIRNQYALGVSVEEIGGRIADSLIRQTGASGEIAETIRDAAIEYADRIISEDTKGAEARAEKLVNSAVVSVGETMRSLAKQGKTSKSAIKRAVADVLAFEYAVDPKTAEGIAERVYSEYDAQLKKSMDAEVQRRYGDKKQGAQTALKDSIAEAINIGAFESEYAEKAAGQLTEKAIKELGTTVEKIALGNSAKKTSIRDAVISMFVSNYGLSQEQAFEIADLVTSQFDNMVGQAADRIIERRFGEKPGREAQKTDTVQKLIEAVNTGAFNTAYASEAANKLFGMDKIKAGNWKAELTAEEIKQISETDFSQDGAYEAIQQQIAERLGREMPATLLEKLREIRKVGMLANPKTQVKNRLGNAPLAVERKVAERLSGGLQELAVKAGIMAKEEQTRTLRVSQQSKDIAKSVYKNNIDRITKKGNKGELRGILKDTRTYFNKGLLQKGIEKATGHQLNDAALDYVRRFTYDCLEKGDAPFVKSAFIDSLAQYCEAQGIKSDADVTETAISYAIDQAMAATFKDASALANLLNSIKDKAGIAGEALDVLFPFTTTPINIGKEFAKYSPIGYMQLIFSKGKSAAEVIDIVSRATTGSAVVYAGYLLRSLGAITGAEDDDKDKAAHDRAKGISPYSILGKYSYEWAQPTGSALAMGAAAYDAMEDGGDLTEVLLNGFLAAGDAYLEQSFFNDIIDLFQGYGSPTENVIREVLTGTVSQFIPTIAGATARTIDPTVRTSYTGGNIIDDILAQAKVKTPGLSKSAPASVNVRGEETKRGNLGERIWDNFIAPWSANRNGKTANAVDKALDEVYEATGDKTIFRQVSPYKVDYGGESYQMTGKEREQFQKIQGQVHDDILQQIIDGGQWKNLSNGEKVKIMQRVNEYALDSAKRELVEARGNKYSSDWDDEEALTDTSSYFVAKVKADKDGNGRISQEELWYYLGLQKDMPKSTKSELWDILTTGKTGYAQYAEKQK